MTKPLYTDGPQEPNPIGLTQYVVINWAWAVMIYCYDENDAYSLSAMFKIDNLLDDRVHHYIMLRHD